MWHPFRKVDSSMGREFIDSYLALKRPQTQRSYRSILLEFYSYLEEHRLSVEDFSDAHAFAYTARCLKATGQKSRYGNSSTVTRATVARKLEILRAFYRHLINLKLLPVGTDPWTNARRELRGATTGEKRPTEMLEFDDVMPLVNSPPPTNRQGVRDRGLLAMLFGGGLRIGEALNVRLGDLQQGDEGGLAIRITEQKNHKIEDQELPPWAADRVALLARQRMREGAGPSNFLICLYRAGSREWKEPMSYKTAWRLFRKLCADAGVPETLTTHSGRATSCTRLLEQGVDQRAVQEFMRHASPAMTQRYDKRLFKGQKAAAKQLSYEEQDVTPQKNKPLRRA